MKFKCMYINLHADLMFCIYFSFLSTLKSGLNYTPNIVKYKCNLKSCLLLSEKLFFIVESACSMRQEHSGSGGFLEFFLDNGKGASVCINSKPFL